MSTYHLLAMLTLCLLHVFLSLLILSKSAFSKNSFRNTIRVSDSLESDQAWHFVRPDLVPNCLQKLSADDTSRQRVNKCKCTYKLLNKLGNVRRCAMHSFSHPMLCNAQLFTPLLYFCTLVVCIKIRLNVLFEFKTGYGRVFTWPWSPQELGLDGGYAHIRWGNSCTID